MGFIPIMQGQFNIGNNQYNKPFQQNKKENGTNIS